MSHECEVNRCLFIVSAHAHRNCNSDAAKDSFYDALRALLQRAQSTDIVVAGDLNAQVGRLSTDEAQLSGCLGLDSVRMDNGDRHLQQCADNKLFLYSKNVRKIRSRLATWIPPTAGQPWTQLDHVAISYR